MAKKVFDITVQIVLNYASIIGTLIIFAGCVHLFTSKDGYTSIGVLTVGSGLILGRAITGALSRERYTYNSDCNEPRDERY
jgi:hypothetical protein